MATSQLDIRIVEARLVRIFDSLKPNQDVFVQLVCGYEDGTEKVVGRTEVCKNGNLAPRWNQRFLCGRDASKGGRTLKFKVHIDHVWRSPVLCGEAEFTLDTLWRRASGRPQEVPVPLFKKGEQTGQLLISIALQGSTGPGGGYSTPVNQMNLEPSPAHGSPGAHWMERPPGPERPGLGSLPERPIHPSADFAGSVGVPQAESGPPGQVPRPDVTDAAMAERRMQERALREQQQRQQEQRMQEQRLQEQMMQEQKLQEQRLQEQRLHEQRLQEQRMYEQRQQEQRLQEQRLQEQRLQEQRQQEQRLQEQRLQEQRLQEQVQYEQRQREQREQMRPSTGSYQMRDLQTGAPLPYLQYPQEPRPQSESFATQRMAPDSFPPQRLAPNSNQPAEVKGVSCGWCKERSPKAQLPIPSSPTEAVGGRSPLSEDASGAAGRGQSGQWWNSFIDRG